MYPMTLQNQSHQISSFPSVEPIPIPVSKFPANITIESLFPAITPSITEPSYPKPIYIPTLTSMNCYNKNEEIWHPCSPSEYITPDNEWVKYYAKNNLSVGIIYRTDDDMYNYPPNGDVWQNADYTLFTGYGDCEDIAIAQVSIDLAKGKKAVVVGGYVTLDNGQKIRDFWIEEYSDGIKSLIATNPSLETQKELRLESLYMFNDKIIWRDYNANWYS